MFLLYYIAIYEPYLLWFTLLYLKIRMSSAINVTSLINLILCCSIAGSQELTRFKLEQRNQTGWSSDLLRDVINMKIPLEIVWYENSIKYLYWCTLSSGESPRVGGELELCFQMIMYLHWDQVWIWLISFWSEENQWERVMLLRVTYQHKELT